MGKSTKRSTRARPDTLLEELEALGRLIDGSGQEVRSGREPHRPGDADRLDAAPPEAGFAETGSAPGSEAPDDEIPVLDLDDGIPVLEEVVGGPADDLSDAHAAHGDTVLDDPAIIMQPGAGEGEPRDPVAVLVADLTRAAAELLEHHGIHPVDTQQLEALRGRLDGIVAHWLGRE